MEYDERTGRREEEQREHIEMQEGNKDSREDTQPLPGNDPLLDGEGHNNQGFQPVETETSFTNDGASTSQPKEAAQPDTSFMNKYIRHTNIPELAEFIHKEYGEKGLYLDDDNAVEYRNFLSHLEKSGGGNIKYKPIGRRVVG